MVNHYVFVSPRNLEKGEKGPFEVKASFMGPIYELYMLLRDINDNYMKIKTSFQNQLKYPLLQFTRMA